MGYNPMTRSYVQVVVVSLPLCFLSFVAANPLVRLKLQTASSPALARLAISRVCVYLDITRAPRGHVSKVWLDSTVVATEHVGPIGITR